MGKKVGLKEKINPNAILEAFKELGRVLVLAAIGWGVSEVASLPATETTPAVLAALRWLDKYVHENARIPVKGVVPF